MGNVLPIEGQVQSSKRESIDYAFSRLRGALTRMNLYGEKVLKLRGELEQSGKSVNSLWRQNVLLQRMHHRQRLQQALDGTRDALPYALCSHTERLENGLRRLEQLLSQRLERRRVAYVGVQAGEADRPNPSHGCRLRESWWTGAALTLCAASVILMVGGLLNSVWSGGVGKVIHIAPKP